MLEVIIHPFCPAGVRAALLDGRLSPEDLLGFVTLMLNPDDSRSVRQQLHEGYSHGGGWRPSKDWTFDENDIARYPGDPAFYPQLQVRIIDSTGKERARLVTYSSAFFGLNEPGVTDGFEMARMD